MSESNAEVASAEATDVTSPPFRRIKVDPIYLVEPKDRASKKNNAEPLHFPGYRDRQLKKVVKAAAKGFDAKSKRNLQFLLIVLGFLMTIVGLIIAREATLV